LPGWAHKLGSGATHGEGTQNIFCGYLAVAVLAGLLGNTLLWLVVARSDRSARDRRTHDPGGPPELAWLDLRLRHLLTAHGLERTVRVCVALAACADR